MADPVSVDRAARDGLSAAEVADRRSRGLVNDVPAAPTRTVGQIVRANMLTRFNFIIGSLLAVILVVGPIQDALFGGVIIANCLIGIIQEVRAKRTLDRLAVLSAPRARVVRDGAVHEVPVGEVVLDDVLEVTPGDQFVVDGVVIEAAGVEADESLLTGESDPVLKHAGDDVLSGSFAAAGTARYRATKVGRDAYAVALAEEARRFTLVTSELRGGIDQIITWAGWAMLPTAGLLFWSQWRANDSIHEALRTSVGGIVAMVPEGLILLTSVAFAVGVVRLARAKALVQELPAIEVLARVDVLCVDKTGTITEGSIRVHAVEAIGKPGGIEEGLGALAAADPNPNATLRAIGEAFAPPGEAWAVTGVVPFSSARKWSAASFGPRGTWVLGGADVLLPAVHAGPDGGAHPDVDAVRRRVDEHAALGRRVTLVAWTRRGVAGEALPDDLSPRALVLLEDTVRSDAPETLAYFAAQGVRLKVISGDHPVTVAAVARRAGIEADAAPVDARTLPDDEEATADALEAATVFGRVTPQQKRAFVKALQSRGHTVAMTGDGVNDVLALKDADVGIAMGSGSAATRSVAQLVLLENGFATLPRAVAEGRRVINNVERVAHLFVTKTVYSMVLAWAVALSLLPFPFLPRHLTLIGSLSIGIPAFFLALGPNDAVARRGYIARVLRFTIPAGTVAAMGTYTAYRLARLEEGVTLKEARTTATVTLLAVGLLVLTRLSRPLTPARRALVLAMGGAFTLVVSVPPLRSFFDLDMPEAIVVLAAIGLVSLAEQGIQLGTWATARVADWWSARPADGSGPPDDADAAAEAEAAPWPPPGPPADPDRRASG